MQSLFTSTSRYARYVRLISWFFDDPSPLSPFSIHRFAIEGKKLGKQIGEWFGPSTAAGAIKVLTNDFTPANLGVALAIDTTVYASEVAHVAQGDEPFGWNRPVLILVPLRLGLNGVNPIYFRSLQHYFTLPQCVGIAGGRPSSSYYFVGSQGQQLFYIDPHHTRPTVKSVNVPDHLQQKAQEEPLSRSTLPQTPDELAEPDSLSLFFANAYGPTELESFHSDKVRKMSLSALDPSMLVGLLCRSKEDWEDLCQRMQTFPKSKEHHQIINIVQEMPAWMRKSTRTISGAGLNASTSSQKGPARPLFSDNTCPKASAQLPQESEMLEDDSMEYADSEDWDIDDSEDDDMKSTEGSEKAEDLGNESIVIKPSSASFQEVFPGSFESDEPDYKASRKTRSPMANLQDLPSKLVVGTPGSAATAEDFERVSLDATTSPATESGEDRSAVLVLPPDLSHRDKPRMPDKRDMSLEVEDKEAGWESFNGRSTS